MDPVKVVQAQVDAYNARDLERFVACYGAETTVTDGAGNVFAQGHDAIRAVWGQLFADSPELHVEIPTRMQVGSWVVDEEHITGFVFPGFPTELRSIAVYQVENGKIAKVTILL